MPPVSRFIDAALDKRAVDTHTHLSLLRPLLTLEIVKYDHIKPQAHTYGVFARRALHKYA